MEIETKVLLCCSPSLAAKLIRLLDAEGLAHELLLDTSTRNDIRKAAMGCTVAVIQISNRYPCEKVVSYLPSGLIIIGYVVHPIRLYLDFIVRCGPGDLNEIIQKILELSGESAAIQTATK